MPRRRRDKTWNAKHMIGGHHETSIRNHLPEVRLPKGRDHADRRMSVFLRMHPMSCRVATKSGRLLHFLFLRIRPMPSRSEKE